MMKFILPVLLFLNGVLIAQAQHNANISPKDVLKFKTARLVRYSDFGAKGDGKTDDMDAIAATHAFANLHQLMVKANAGATYYIGGKDRTAIIQTDTDFGTAAFIIDDTEVENRNASVFMVSSALKPFKMETISSLKRNQEKINAPLPGPCLITVTNANVKQYILTNFSSEIASLNASTPKIQDVQAVKNKLKLLIQDGLYEGAIAKQAAWPQDLIDLGSFLGVSAPVLQTSMGTAAAKNIGGQNTAAQQMSSPTATSRSTVTSRPMARR